jgi:hypothetical protein
MVSNTKYITNEYNPASITSSFIFTWQYFLLLVLLTQIATKREITVLRSIKNKGKNTLISPKLRHEFSGKNAKDK